MVRNPSFLQHTIHLASCQKKFVVYPNRGIKSNKQPHDIMLKLPEFNYLLTLYADSMNQMLRTKSEASRSKRTGLEFQLETNIFQKENRKCIKKYKELDQLIG